MSAGTTETRSIVVVSAGVSEPSSTALLAGRLADRTRDSLHAQGIDAQVSTIELRTLVGEIGKASVAGFVGEGLRPAVERLAGADAVIAATPVYKAGISGLFKSFIDVLDDDLLIGKPVAVTATAGSARHALIPDEHMRALFAYLRALVIPTSLFAAPEDWGARALGDRIDRAATELAALVASGVGRTIAERTWAQHDHTFGNGARFASAVSGGAVAGGGAAGHGGTGGGTAGDFGEIDFDSDLMRLAIGGGGSGAGAKVLDGR